MCGSTLRRFAVRRRSATSSRAALDLILACLPDAFPGFHRQRIYADRDVLAVRRGHPLGKRLRHLDTFREARHVAVACDGAREDMIDAWLRRRGIERRIALTVPGYLQALRMAARTDLVAFVPGRLVAALAGRWIWWRSRRRSTRASTSNSCSIRRVRRPIPARSGCAIMSSRSGGNSRA